jgi:hypothetical protein
VKVLLDENLPHQLRLELPGHDVFTVAYMNWSGIENGALLRLAAENDFDAVLTNDRGLEHEQNLERLPVAVIVLLTDSNTIEAIRPHCNEVLSTLAHLRKGELAKVPVAQRSP